MSGIPKELREIQHYICEIFNNYAEYNMVDIALFIETGLDIIFGKKLDVLDKHKLLRETYQTLAYHHKLYKDGETTLKWFKSICNEERF